MFIDMRILFLIVSGLIFCFSIITEANTCSFLFSAIKASGKLVSQSEIRHRIISTGSSGKFLIGFEPDSSGRLMPKWSAVKGFTSVRYVPSSGGMFGGTGWNPLREALLVNIGFQKQSRSIVKADSRQAFPLELHARLNKGEYPETEKPFGPPSYETILSLINSPKEEWHVLMLAASKNDFEMMTTLEGRSGVILKNGLPYISINENGIETILDQKGVGLPEGGFQEPIRQTHGAISGGVSGQRTEREFMVAQILKDLTQVSVPLVAQYVGKFGAQGVVFRWSPGTRRASFAFEDRTNGVRDKNFLELNGKKLSALLGRTIIQLLNRGYLPRLHMENFVVSGDAVRIDLTDFSDINPLSSIAQSKDFLSSLLGQLEVLLKKNHVNLGGSFSHEEFINGLVSEADKLGLPKAPFEPELEFNYDRRGIDVENYISRQQDTNLRYVVYRAVSVGMARSLGRKPIHREHRLDVHKTLTGLQNSLLEHKDISSKIEKDFRDYQETRFGVPDNFERKIIEKYEESATAKRLGWTLDGAREYFSQNKFKEEYREYLKSFAAVYGGESRKSKGFLESGIERRTEFKPLIYEQRHTVQELDLIYFSYLSAGDVEMANYYRGQLERVFSMTPLEYLENYQSKKDHKR